MWQPSWSSEPDIRGQRFTLPAELEDGRIPHMFGKLANLFSMLFLAALIWASFAEMRELAIGHGEIAPSGHVQTIQHLEGGQVESIEVREGQQVEAGAILVRLSPIAAASDLNQLHIRAASLRLHKEALSALIEERAPDFMAAEKDYPDLASEQMQLYTAKRDQISQERRALKARVSQRKAEYEASKLEAGSLKSQMEINQEQLAIRAKLLKSGYTSRRAYLQTKASLEDVKARYFSTIGRRDAAKEQLEEANSAAEGGMAESLKLLNEERSKVSSELAELTQQVNKHEDRVDRLVVRSPIRGIVHELAQKTPGEVVKPGDLVARVVPLDASVVAEVRVDPKDVGHIKAGDRVEVKLSTFDPNVFGVVMGRVDVVSASTFKNEDGEPYYKVIIALDQRTVGEGKRRRQIQPGMVVEANIITGSKSLVKYLLKPVYRSLDIGFSER